MRSSDRDLFSQEYDYRPIARIGRHEVPLHVPINHIYNKIRERKRRKAFPIKKTQQF